jgi:adenosylmethionine---8-amino-7-oxononanoate aminotransferase
MMFRHIYTRSRHDSEYSSLSSLSSMGFVNMKFSTTVLRNNMNRTPPLLSTLELLRLDRQHVWHPYAAAGPTAAAVAAGTTMDHVVPIESAQGVYLKVRSGSSYDSTRTTTNGSTGCQELVDGMSNWWATIHGYNHPTLNDAVINQVSQMSHVMFGGLTHEPAVQLCTKLCQLTELDVCFLSDSGSVAVEVAMKMAIQYWNGRYQQSSSSSSSHTKSKFITVRNGYHGDTFAAMSVCDPVNGMHHTQFQHGILQQHYFVRAPTPSYPHSNLPMKNNSNNDNNEEEEFDDSHMKELIDTLEQYHLNIAAMILEPIVQGAGGMRMYHPSYLRRIRELCTQYDVLLIYDEIATGFGRTNQFFGHDHCDDGKHIIDNDVSNNNDNKCKPDIICLGKALTGGYMSLAATITTNHVAEIIHTVASSSDSTAPKYQPVLMHGPTFMGNPLACSVALASISLLENSPPMSPTSTTLPQHTATCTDWRRSVPMIEQQLRNELMECTESEHVQSVRVLGAIGVVEMKHPIRDMKLLQHNIVKEYGVWLRPFGKLIYTMPPFIISTEQLRKITTAMVQLSRRRF